MHVLKSPHWCGESLQGCSRLFCNLAPLTRLAITTPSIHIFCQAVPHKTCRYEAPRGPDAGVCHVMNGSENNSLSCSGTRGLVKPLDMSHNKRVPCTLMACTSKADDALACCVEEHDSCLLAIATKSTAGREVAGTRADSTRTAWAAAPRHVQEKRPVTEGSVCWV
jgi:hypothetical protein